MLMQNFDNFSAREASIRRMASLLSAHGDLLADMLRIAVPADIDGQAGRLAYLFAAAMMDLHERRSLLDPGHEAQSRIQDAEMRGTPYTVLEQEAMAQRAMGYIPYWNGQKYSFADEIFWKALQYGSVSEFDRVKAEDRRIEREMGIADIAGVYKAVADDAYKKAVAAAKQARKDAMADAEAKMAELVKPEQDARDKADAAWRSAYPGMLGEHPSKRELEARDRADDLYTELETAEEALDIAKHERFPAYFVKSAQAEDAYKKAVAEAEQVRNEAYKAAEERAVAEYDAAHGTDPD